MSTCSLYVALRRRFTQIVWCKLCGTILWLVVNALITSSSEYVAFSRSYDSLHLLTNFDYWFKEIQFEQRFRVGRNAALFGNRHCVDIFGIPIRVFEEFFGQVPSWWTDYDGSCLFLAPITMFLTYKFTLVNLKELRSLLFCIAVAQHCLYALLLFFTSALISAPFNHTRVLEGSTTLAEWGILLPMPRGVHALVSDFGLFSISQGLQFN